MLKRRNDTSEKRVGVRYWPKADRRRESCTRAWMSLVQAWRSRRALALVRIDEQISAGCVLKLEAHAVRAVWRPPNVRAEAFAH
eukprot:6202651-Pleurochrysis_carterae.AAC.1